MSVYVEKGTSVFWYTRKLQSLLAPRKNIALHLVAEEGVSSRNGRAEWVTSFVRDTDEWINFFVVREK